MVIQQTLPYTGDRLVQVIRDVSIELPEAEYAKEELLEELGRRRIRATARTLSFHISNGTIDPPRREEGRRGRPGKYNGSAVAVLDLLRIARLRQAFPYPSEFDHKLDILKRQAAANCGRPQTDGSIRPLPLDIDTEYARLICETAPKLVELWAKWRRKQKALYGLKFHIEQVEQEIRDFKKKLNELKELDASLAAHIERNLPAEVGQMLTWHWDAIKTGIQELLSKMRKGAS